MSASSLRYVVAADDPRRAADAVVTFQLQRPTTVAGVVIVLLVGSFLGSAYGFLGSVVVVLVLVALIAVIAQTQRRRLRASLSSRGLRPGSAVRVVCTPAGFEVRTDIGSAKHAYGDVARWRENRGMLLAQLRAQRFLVVLPSQVVPADLRRRLATGGPARRP